MDKISQLKQLRGLDLNTLSEEQLDDLLNLLDTVKNKSPLDYEPHSKQLLFHKSPAKIRFLSGGNRSGKTTGGVVEDAMHLTGIYPLWFPQDLRIKTANKGRIIVTDFDKGAKTIEDKLLEWIPKDNIISLKRTNKGGLVSMEVRHISGGISHLEILTHEQDDDVFEGWSGHWAHFDEPPPREKFIGTLRGLIDFKGRCMLTLTPISQPWLYDEFISKAENNDNIFYLVVDMFDNPHTPDTEKKMFFDTLTEDEKEARIHGRFRHLTGLVYKEFDPSVHVISKSKVKIEPSWPKYFVCDPHDRKEMFGIWATVDPLGTVYIINEIKYKGTIEQFSKQVLLREKMFADLHIKSDDVIRIGDPNKMQTPSAVNGLKFREEFSKYGLHFIVDVNNDIALGHLAVAGRLQYNKEQPLSTTNKPKLFFIKEYCSEVIRYMQMYVWDDWKGSGRDTRSAKEKPQEKFKDFCDCVRYLIMFNPTFYVEEPDPVSHSRGSATSYGL